jgi:AI-2 transport protein TqsA
MGRVRSTTQEQTRSQLHRGLIVLLTLAGAVLVGAGAKASASILGPALLAVVLTIALFPLARVAERRGWPTWVGGLLVLLGVYLVLLTLVGSLLIAGARLTTILADYTDELRDLSHSATSKLTDLGVGATETNALTDSIDLARVADALRTVLSSAGALLSLLALVVTLLLFFGLDAQLFARRLTSQRSTRPTMVAAFESFAHGTRVYLVVSTIFGLIVAVIDTAFLSFTPIPAPLVWGLLAFITNYIPNVGFVLGLIPPALLGLIEGGPRLMLLVIAVYCVVNFILQSIIQPRYVGDAVGLSGSVTVLSLVFWAWLLGPLGAFLAVPLTLLVKALMIDADPQAHWLQPLISSPDEPTTNSNDRRSNTDDHGDGTHPVPRAAVTRDIQPAPEPEPGPPLS